jgi:hypothetical protein
MLLLALVSTNRQKAEFFDPCILHGLKFSLLTVMCDVTDVCARYWQLIAHDSTAWGKYVTFVSKSLSRQAMGCADCICPCQPTTLLLL